MATWTWSARCRERRSLRSAGDGTSVAKAAAMSMLLPAIGFGIVTASILAVAGVGFTLQFGVTNILNLAYGDIMTPAAFVAYLVTREGISVWLALGAGAAFGAVLSVLLNPATYPPLPPPLTPLF